MSVYGIIYTIITICIIIMVFLIGVVAYIYWDKKRKENGKIKSSKTKTTNTENPKMQGIESMSKFLAFDEIVDSMIVRKNRQQYVMVIQCKGVNYDLLGEEEKIAVERGFTQFLNTLRFPVQLYIQSRSLNLKDNLEKYHERIAQVKEEIQKIDAQIKRETANGKLDLVRRMEFDRRRKMNILEYGLDVTNYVSRMSQNRNVLQQNSYVVISYHTAEFGEGISKYSKEEVNNIAFSELYTRAQTTIRGLSSAGVTGRVLKSEELAELLYIAYNRDDSELINIRKLVAAQYDSLYTTAKDVMDKQKELIEEQIEKEAIDLTANSIKKADRIRKLRRDNQEEIKRRALGYVEAYKNEMTEELYDETKKQIEKADLLEEKPKAKTAVATRTAARTAARTATKTATTAEAQTNASARTTRVRRKAQES